MLFKQIYCVIFLLVAVVSLHAQNNLIESDRWEVGVNTDQFGPEFLPARAGSGRNFVESINNPFGEPASIWHSKIGANETFLYPGFRTQQFTSADIDINKDYRYSVWINATFNSTHNATLVADGTGYDFELGANGPTNQRVNFCNSKNIPGINQWYLVVGYIRAANSSEVDDGYTIKSGYYQVGGNQVTSGLGQTIGRFHPTKTNVKFSVGHQIYAQNSAHEMFFYNPRFDVIDGQEPSIANLTDPNWVETIGNSGTGLWSSIGNDINYNTGNVGIGTTTPDSKLTVKGKIHAEEVKVDLSVPAPDYVFKEDYNLKTLTEVQNYINKNGHLPNIPSAKEMETNGIELSIMNMKLLEKIEELTLYILEQEKRIEKLEKNKKQ